MADFYTSKWGNNYSPQIRLVVSVANLNGNTARVSWILDYVTSGYTAYTNGIARNWSINIDGQVRSGTYNINGVSSTTRISSGTIDVARGTSARNIAVSASFNFDVTWAGSYSGSRTASGSVGVERKVSYTVSFNANGGSGAPGSQTRWYGEVITLSSTRPTRYGYIFQGWAKSASGAVEYQPGSKYGLDANTTLYAIWKAETYAVSFNANGGSGAPGNQTKTYGQTLTLSSTKPTRTNYNFLGWATSSGSSTAEYQAGGSYTNNTAVTLYAVWQLAYTPPRVTNVRSDRCNSASTLTEEGTYVKVTFNWVTDYNISAIYIRHKASNSSTWSTTTVSATGKVGSVTQVIGSNGINTEYMYNIQIEVRDSVGSSTVNQDVPAMSYTIDFKAGGKGVAIGKPATENNLFEVGLPTRFSGGVNYIYIPSGQNLNNYTTSGFYYNPLNSEATNIANTPVNESFTLEVSKHAGIRQIFTRYNYDQPRTWIRNYYGGTWGAWFEIILANQFNGYFDNRMNATFNGKFDSAYNNKVAVSYDKNIALGYGLQGRLIKRGHTVTISAWRQVINWGGSGEFKLLNETIPSDIIPVHEVNLILTKNAGSFNPPPMTIHIQKDGHMYYTNFNPGTWVHCGTVTYQLI